MLNDDDDDDDGDDDGGDDDDDDTWGTISSSTATHLESLRSQHTNWVVLSQILFLMLSRSFWRSGLLGLMFFNLFFCAAKLGHSSMGVQT